MVGGVSGETKEVSGKTPLPRPAGKFFIPRDLKFVISWKSKIDPLANMLNTMVIGYLPNLSPTKPPSTLRFSLFVQKTYFPS